MGDPAAMTSSFGPGDPAQERAIATRRALEAARLQRIKDPKSRIMGIDVESLHSQVAEKNAQKDAERTLRDAYDQQRLQQDAQLAYLEQERLRAERVKAQFVDDFNRTNMKKELTREYDLNDPLSRFKDLPGRVGDDDLRLTVSGMQQFHGEDLNHAHRKKMQQAEQKRWNDEMVAAKQANADQDKALTALYAERAMEVDKIKTDLEATAKASRSASSVAVAEYQLAQAAAKREREAAAQKAELQDNVEEIQSHLAGDLLTENPAVGRSFIAPNRVRPDHFKGMSSFEKSGYSAAQEAQRMQNVAAKEQLKAEEATVDQIMEGTRRAGLYQDAQVAAMRREIKKQVMADNEVLAQQQYAAKSFLKGEVYTNAIDGQFFDQFGTSSR